MNAVLVAAYFVMLAMTVVSVLIAVRVVKQSKKDKQTLADERKLTKQWSQRLVKQCDEKLEEAKNSIQQAGQEGFDAGRADMLAEFKHRVDNGEIEVKVISTPVAQPTPVFGGTIPNPNNGQPVQMPAPRTIPVQ